MSDKWLFLVDVGGKWTLATIDGKPVVTSLTNHFGGRTPLVAVSQHLENYIDLEESLRYAA